MAKQRSEEDLLHRLDTVHLRGGQPAFRQDLADIRASRIRNRHLEIFKRMMNDAEGLQMLGDPEVRATKRHVAKERRRLRRVAVASGNGHALTC
ncbi:hypothetical protein A2765_01985 [Candidatus Kaiserbacteria bacterium RIFCSPHIGHO2_01_FULL_56_24]|uniref:Uncharacterized protein n=1 Tax=Candidatus Kaiserbacteria bacterium RIFCSPHIGHO2_01_FULL_56_24 TaxID=1798487 RepID=A0A1F6DAT2_9BACT|nr:MAG: hypothetical protein A2765_01985 [Candidatus Kaiserbacteria bacterium RIFCSPHIGHO2_01_FULL_56_24]